MKHQFTILVACLSAVGCSSGRKNRDGGTNDGATIDVELADVGESDAASNDTGAGTPDSGANDPGTRPEPLCDGAQHLRLWVFIQPGNEVRGSMVRVENGFPFIAIDGTCSYWIGGGWMNDAVSRDRPIRTGKMTEADVASVEQSVPLGDIATLGDCPPPPPGLYDYSFRFIRTATTYVSCFTSAPALTAGTRFEAGWMTLERIANTLWGDGTPVNGALHVSAVDAPGDRGHARVHLAHRCTARFSRPRGRLRDEERRQSPRLGSHAASQLRALRDQYLADRTAQPSLYVSWDGLKVTDQTRHRFRLHAGRDSLRGRAGSVEVLGSPARMGSTRWG